MFQPKKLMLNSDAHDSPGYWYSVGEHERSVGVLNAMRDYRSAEGRMRRRMRDEMKMGEKDLSAIRLVLGAAEAGREMTPTELSRELQITTASTTLLIDRLVARGHVERAPHPTDRRALVLSPTAQGHEEVQSTLGGMHTRMMGAVAGMSADETATVVAFLGRMRDAVSPAV